MENRDPRGFSFGGSEQERRVLPKMESQHSIDSVGMLASVPQTPDMTSTPIPAHITTEERIAAITMTAAAAAADTHKNENINSNNKSNNNNKNEKMDEKEGNSKHNTDRLPAYDKQRSNASSIPSAFDHSGIDPVTLAAFTQMQSPSHESVKDMTFINQNKNNHNNNDNYNNNVIDGNMTQHAHNILSAMQQFSGNSVFSNQMQNMSGGSNMMHQHPLPHMQQNQSGAIYSGHTQPYGYGNVCGCVYVCMCVCVCVYVYVCMFFCKNKTRAVRSVLLKL